MKTYYNSYGDKIKINSIKLNQIVYHCTLFKKDYQFFELLTSEGNYNAIWVSPDEDRAKEFSMRFFDDDDETKCIEIPICFKIKVESSGIADLDFKNESTKALVKDYGSLLNCIDDLKKLGFNGWITNGSIDEKNYEDIAIFNDNKLKIIGISYFKKDVWSEYISIEEFKSTHSV